MGELQVFVDVRIDRSIQIQIAWVGGGRPVYWVEQTRIDTGFRHQSEQ